tara:strand:+ start:3131 stop:4240 length:1110 start_codon:yes stop_codon:yes gene_type:complete
MAFLDNSGDIILDAVLTDTGRLRLAQGDGSFKISKFALGDDEINYALYNKNHASGSAYFDLEILQTPVLEAITNNSAQIKSRLMTISRTNLLFMPILKLNTNRIAGNNNQIGSTDFFFRAANTAGDIQETARSASRFYVAADDFTFTALTNRRAGDGTTTQTTSLTAGDVSILQGQMTDINHFSCVRIDQGLDTTEIHPSVNLEASLVETAFLVEMDYRLGRIKKPANNEMAVTNFIDDDNVASYYLTTQGTNGFINPTGTPPSDNKVRTGETGYEPTNPQVFNGPRGNTLQFRIEASQELQSSTYLYTQLGSSVAIQSNGADSVLGLDTSDDYLAGKTTIHFIDTTVRVIGANTGFRLDVPVRYVKIA